MTFTIKKDKEYKKIVKDIFRNSDFKKLYNIPFFSTLFIHMHPL